MRRGPCTYTLGVGHDRRQAQRIVRSRGGSVQSAVDQTASDWLWVAGGAKCLGAGVGGLGADHRSLCADECRFGALVSGACAVDRALMQGGGVSGSGLLTRGQSDQSAGGIEGFLLGVAAVLSVVEGFLVDVAVDLFPVDPGLAVIKDRRQTLIGRAAFAALLVVTELLEVDAVLFAVAGELLTVADGLLEFGEALLFGELACPCLLISL